MSREIRLGSLNGLRPTVNFANKIDAEPGQQWGPRTIGDCQLFYVFAGRAVLEMGGLNYPLRAGDCAFYGADSPHRIAADKHEPPTFSSLHFAWDEPSPVPVPPYDRLKNVLPTDLRIEPVVYAVDVDGYGEVAMPVVSHVPQLEPLFLHIVKEFRVEEPGHAWMLRALLMQLLAALIRQRMNERYLSANHQKIIPALEAVRRRPEEDWTSERMAELCGYHPTYFAALFGECMGCGPKAFVVAERLRKAKRLLMEGLQVEAVSQAVGYGSVHYFCRSFKQATGLTPTEFRRRSLEL